MARVLLGATGSVAAVKVPELVARLAAAGHAVKVAPTRGALAFFGPDSLPPPAAPEPEAALVVRGQHRVYLDEDEWPTGRLFRVGEPVLHIELRRWAEVLVIAPIDANTLAKLALGLCDNLLTCVYRAWDRGRPVVLAPAMNTLMWEHPATARHLRQVEEDLGGAGPGARLRLVPPQTRLLACGDEGLGAMAAVDAIAAVVGEILAG